MSIRKYYHLNQRYWEKKTYSRKSMRKWREKKQQKNKKKLSENEHRKSASIAFVFTDVSRVLFKPREKKKNRHAYVWCYLSNVQCFYWIFVEWLQNIDAIFPLRELSLKIDSENDFTCLRVCVLAWKQRWMRCQIIDSSTQHSFIIMPYNHIDSSESMKFRGFSICTTTI